MNEVYEKMATNTQQETVNGSDCERCGHHSSLKGNLIQHLQKKNSCRPLNSTKSRQDIITELTRVSDKEKVHKCDYCVKMFSTAAGKCQHKKICPSRPEMAIKNQVNSMQQQIDTLASQSGIQVPLQQVPTALPAVVQTVFIDIQSLKEQLRQEIIIELKTTSNQLATTSNKTVSQKHKIPYSVRCKAWITHIGADVGQTKCLCCKENTITQFKFTCGHIISRADGGTLAMENLRPICYDCNNDMGNENMREFAQRIYNVEII